MKKLLLAVLVLTLSFNLGFSQLYVDGDGNVGVDKQDPINARFEVSNDNSEKSIRVTNANSSSQSYNYGIWNSVENTGASTFKIGQYNYVNHTGTSYQYVYGLRNFIGNYGYGLSYGVYNELKYGTGTKQGTRNYIYQDASASSQVYGTL